VLPDRYANVERIGLGGMGEIFRADDTALGRTVAVKVLAEWYAADESVRARFTREAHAAARLSAAPNTVTIFDVGEEDGRPYIVMELMSGGSLADRLAEGGAQPPARALVWLEDAARALDAAHEHGVVHRDVKPGNLLLDGEGHVKVADFGIATAAGLDSLTQDGTVLGTAGYLAPEQARGERVTAAADIYAVGAVLYELLAGEPSRTAGSLAELGSEDGFQPPDLAERVPTAPPELVAAVSACLSVRLEDRPSSAAALARLLAPVASEAETLSLPPDPAQRATEILVRPDTPRAWWTGQRLAAIAALVVAAVAGLVAAVALTGGGGGHSSPPPGSTSHAVTPPAAGTNVADQAHKFVIWLRQHSG
jgi:serine/threonine protein kinase